MQVAEIMTSNPTTVQADVSPDDAMQLMDDEDVRHLPVKQGEALVGVISDRDLLSVIGWLPARTPQARAAHAKAGCPATVREIMHASVKTIEPGDTVVTAVVEFMLGRIGCLPVVEGRTLVGIVTEMDLLAAFHDACRSGDFGPEIDPPVSDLMTTSTQTGQPDMSFEEAAALCSQLSIRHLPIVHDGRLQGIVSDRDLRSAAGSDEPGETTIDRIMSRQPVTLDPDDSASRAAMVMASNRFSAVPIVTDGHLAGLLTLTDLLAHCLEALREPERSAND